MANKPKEKAVEEVSREAAEAPSKFIADLGSLMFYQIHGSKQPFESQPEPEKQHWYDLAVSAHLSIDKLNMMIAPRVEPEDVELKRNKNVRTLTNIIENFVKGLKTIKCPKCGTNAEIRPMIFPCTELANRIWNGEVK